MKKIVLSAITVIMVMVMTMNINPSLIAYAGYTPERTDKIEVGKENNITLDPINLDYEAKRHIEARFTLDTEANITITVKSSGKPLKWYGDDNAAGGLSFIGEDLQGDSSKASTWSGRVTAGAHSLWFYEGYQYSIQSGTGSYVGYGLACSVLIEIEGAESAEKESDEDEIEDDQNQDTVKPSENPDGNTEIKDDNEKTRTAKITTIMTKSMKSIKLADYIIGDKSNIKWSTSNEDVVDFDNKKKGIVYGVFLGTATVTAKFTDTNQMLKFEIIVNEDDFEGCEMINGKKIGKLAQDIPESIKENIEGIKGYKKIKWKSSNKSIATLKNYMVTGKKKGKCYITGKKDGITYKLNIKVGNNPANFKDAKNSWMIAKFGMLKKTILESSPSGNKNQYDVIISKVKEYADGSYQNGVLRITRKSNGRYKYSYKLGLVMY
jgi:hypothetical protein